MSCDNILFAECNVTVAIRFVFRHLGNISQSISSIGRIACSNQGVFVLERNGVGRHGDHS